MQFVETFREAASDGVYGNAESFGHGSVAQVFHVVEPDGVAAGFLQPVHFALHGLPCFVAQNFPARIQGLCIFEIPFVPLAVACLLYGGNCVDALADEAPDFVDALFVGDLNHIPAQGGVAAERRQRFVKLQIDFLTDILLFVFCKVPSGPCEDGRDDGVKFFAESFPTCGAVTAYVSQDAAV